jgi:hypothetical protein
VCATVLLLLLLLPLASMAGPFRRSSTCRARGGRGRPRQGKAG